MKNYLTLFALALFAVGCNKNTDDYVPIEKKTVTFEGKPDKQFAGTWKTSDGVSVYKIEQTGAYILDSVIPMKGAPPLKTHSEGQWVKNGDKLLFKDPQGNVVPYAYKLEGNKLELTLGGTLKKTTSLTRTD